MNVDLIEESGFIHTEGWVHDGDYPQYDLGKIVEFFKNGF